jgi:hypothetical protein
VEECTYFWGVNTSWGINTAESKRPINQEDNQAPQPTTTIFDPSQVPMLPTKDNAFFQISLEIEQFIRMH